MISNNFLSKIIVALYEKFREIVVILLDDFARKCFTPKSNKQLWHYNSNCEFCFIEKLQRNDIDLPAVTHRFKRDGFKFMPNRCF